MSFRVSCKDKGTYEYIESKDTLEEAIARAREVIDVSNAQNIDWYWNESVLITHMPSRERVMELYRKGFSRFA